MSKSSWLFFAAQRFGSVDARGRSALTSLLSVLGIAFGVTSLIVILSVMNGFQMGYIDTILEAGSYHVQVPCEEGDIDILALIPGVRSVTPFREMQGLAKGRFSRQSALIIRSVPENTPEKDRGFADTVEMTGGVFSFTDNGIVLGSILARNLAVAVGDTVSLIAVSGTSESDMFPPDADLPVRGIFKTGYYEIDSGLAFVGPATGKRLSGEVGGLRAGIKLDHHTHDERVMARIRSRLPALNPVSWREYNRAFFGALRIEKNTLLFLVFLIFVVVTVNIYNSMRKAVYERREEIGVMAALGGRIPHIRLIFLLNGFGIGLTGALIGLLIGLLLAVRINDVFLMAENIVNGINRFAGALLGSAGEQTFSLFSPEFFYIDSVPVRIFFPEVLAVFLFGVLSAAVAAWLAGNSILRLKPAEVLRYE